VCVGGGAVGDVTCACQRRTHIHMCTCTYTCTRSQRSVLRGGQQRTGAPWHLLVPHAPHTLQKSAVATLGCCCPCCVPFLLPLLRPPLLPPSCAGSWSSTAATSSALHT
jgi:hypothetical protein